LANSKQVASLCTKYTGQEKVHSKLQAQLRNLFAHRVQPTKKGVSREYEKIAVRLGRLKQQFKYVAYLYDIKIEHNPTKTYATALHFNKNEDLTSQRNSGIYCLTTNVKNLSAQSLWETYTTLTEIEAAFRSLKSELGMRPVYHQLENRIDGHIFISIIAYHLLHTIRYQLKKANICNNWNTIRDILALQIRSTTSLNLKNGGIVRVRKTSQATPEQSVIYKALGISSKPGKINKTYIHQATTCSASPL
jgi:transposase